LIESEATPDREAREIRTLNLVTNVDAPFYQQQVRALSRQGVTQRTLPVPGGEGATGWRGSSRSLTDYLRYLPTVLRHSRGEFDLVHANYGLTAPAALAQPTRPVVLSFWGSDLLGDLGWLCQRAARRADAVIVMSERMAARLSTDCWVVPHGVDMDLFRPIRAERARTAIGWESGCSHVLFPYSPHRSVKDFPRAREIVRRVRNQFAGEIRLHAVADAPHYRMPLYMNAADVLLLTSRWEGSPNAVKEALACNLPVVATDVGDVEQRVSGLGVSTICRTDSELVSGLRAALEHNCEPEGRSAIQALSLERMGRRVREVYRLALDG